MTSADQDLCDSSAMATDIADLLEHADPIGFAHVSDIFGYGGGHAFNVLTDSGRAFRLTVTEIPQYAPGRLHQHDFYEPHSHEVRADHLGVQRVPYVDLNDAPRPPSPPARVCHGPMPGLTLRL